MIPPLRHRRSQGMTFFELLIMIVLLTGGIIWGLYANFLGLRVVAQSHTALLAVKGVQEYYLEYIRSLSFDQIGGPGSPASLGGPFTITSTGASSTWGAPAFGDLPGGQGWYWVQPGDDSNMKRVTVHVRWTDPDGRIRDSDLSTTISRSGLTN